MPKQAFEGGFIKIKLDSPQQENFGKPKAQSLYEDSEISYPDRMEFDKELYKKVGEDIIKILGKKEEYSVEEAVLYFQKKYLAHRIPYEYMLNYLDTYYREKFEPTPYGPEHEFEYDDMSGEKNVTLFIDTVFNEDLKKRYPKIAEVREWQLNMMKERIQNFPKSLKMAKKYGTVEMFKQHKQGQQEYQKFVESGKAGYNNPIIIIGYIEENVINSMYLVNIGPIGIDDIHYEMYYFYKHS